MLLVRAETMHRGTSYHQAVMEQFHQRNGENIYVLQYKEYAPSDAYEATYMLMPVCLVVEEYTVSDTLEDNVYTYHVYVEIRRDKCE